MSEHHRSLCWAGLAGQTPGQGIRFFSSVHPFEMHLKNCWLAGLPDADTAGMRPSRPQRRLGLESQRAGRRWESLFGSAAVGRGAPNAVWPPKWEVTEKTSRLPSKAIG